MHVDVARVQYGSNYALVQQVADLILVLLFFSRSRTNLELNRILDH
jgi:hypothetical protein